MVEQGHGSRGPSRARRRGWRRAVVLVLVSVIALVGAGPAIAIPAQFNPSTATGLIGANKDVGALRECPTGKVVVGVRAQDRTNAAPASAYGILVQLDLLCGTIDVDASGAVVVTPDTSWMSYNPYDQGSGVVTQALCPAGTVAHRMGGNAFYGTTTNGVRLYWASTISLGCRPPILDATGALRINLAAPAVTPMAGRNENTNDVRFHGWFCGTNADQMIVGYRPQYGGEGFDGITPSCATVGRDFDDAPSRYGSASHEMNSATYLGSAMTVERASKPSETATLDQGDDGVADFPRLVQGQTDRYDVVVTATNHATLPATLAAWIDWNGDGSFAADELATAVVPPGTSSEAVTLSWADVARRTTELADGVTQLGSRFRIGVGAVDGPTGAGAPGEVEDYMVTLEPMRPALWIVKSTSSTGALPAVGDRIEYTFTVGNSGNVTVADLVLEDPNVDPGSISCEVTSLEPDERTNCTAFHTVTQADVDAGNVRNQATVRGTDPGGDPVNATSNVVQVPPETVVDLTIEKATAVPAVREVGQVITYEFTVTNRGTVTMRDVRVTDPMVSGLSCTFTVFAPGDVERCSATHTVTQAELDAGGTIDNVATVTGTPPGATEPVSTDSEVVRVPVEQSPSLSVIKRTNTEQVDTPGQTVAYGIEVRNTGNVTITDLVVRDPGADSVTCEATVLAPGDAMHCLAQRKVHRDEIDAGGQLRNTAEASGSAPGGGTIEQPSNEVALPIVQRPGIAVVKSTTAEALPPVGEEISYSYVVENTGNVTLDPVTVDDDVLGAIDCGAEPLAAGSTRGCEACDHLVTHADVDRGGVVNTSNAECTPPGGADPVSADSEEVRVPGEIAPGLEIVKRADTTSIHTVGQRVTYTFTVRNSGNVTLSNVTVTDERLNGDLDCPPVELAPDSTMSCTAVHTVTQADLDDGVLENTADVAGSTPGGAQVSSGSNLVALEVEERPELRVRKSSTASELPPVGETIEYRYVVTNTGNVAVRDLELSDDRIEDVICPSSRLAAGASMTCRGTYRVTQADVDAGTVRNTVSATATTPEGASVPPAGDALTIPGDQVAAIDVEKTSDVISVRAVGETIAYTFTVRNIGNVTLTAPSVTDSRVPAVECPAGVTLAPGDQTQCTGSYTVTQADLDRGIISNIAAGSATDPGGAALEPVPSNQRDVAVDGEPAMEVDKTAADPVDANGSGVLDAGDTVHYDVTIRNVGNLTLLDVRVNDPKIPGMSCPPGALAVGESTTCSGDYRLTQDDVDAGSVVNRAAGTARTPDGSAVPPVWSQELTIPLAAAPALELVKRAETNELVAGEEITYTFTVRNTGNVTLTGITIDETAFSGSGELGAVDCPAAAQSLAPGDEVRCTASYEVSQADVDRGSLVNTATASGTPPVGDAVDSDPATARVPQEPTPAITMAKSASPSSGTAAGEEITYTFTVRNTGNVTLRDVTVTEGEFTGTGELGPVICPAAAMSLEPDAEVDCRASYTLTQADVDAGGVTNSATATGTPPDGAAPPVSAPSEVALPIDPAATPPATSPPSSTPAPGGLPRAGVEIGAGIALLVVLLLSVGGGAIVVARRKRIDG